MASEKWPVLTALLVRFWCARTELGKVFKALLRFEANLVHNRIFRLELAAAPA